MPVTQIRSGPGLRRSVVKGAGEVELAVVSTGDATAPGILFIHGFAQSSLSFDRQLRSDLAERYHLVAFDLRGQGASDKPAGPQCYLDSQTWADDVAAVIAATGLLRPVLVGWSLGGYVAMDYVRHHGMGAIAGINMVGSTGGLVDSHIMAIIAASTDDPSLDADLAAAIRAADATASMYATTQTAEEHRTLFATELMMPAYVRRAMVARDLAHFDLVEAIDKPILFSTGTADPLVPAEDIAKLRQALPAACHSLYEGAAHLPFIDETARFNRELDAFAQLAASATGVGADGR